MNQKDYTLTPKQLEIMKVLWKNERPILASEISQQANVAENSCLPLINQLISKGYIQVAGNVKIAKTTGRLFSAKVSFNEYIDRHMKDVFSTEKSSYGIYSLLQYFVKNNKKSEKDKIVEELEKFIEDYRDSKKQ